MARSTYSRRQDRLNRRPSFFVRSAVFAMRSLLALVFIFSGFVKAVDPLGTAYKIEEYARSFGNVFEHLVPAALPLSVLLCSFELFLGLALLFKLRFKLIYGLSAIFMFIMTALTLYTAIENPVSDCGCFGDALTISNNLTFVKNLILLFFALFLFFTRKRFLPWLSSGIETFFLFVLLVASFSITIYSCYRLPIVDFRPYKVGVNIQEAMQVPEGAPKDEYKTTFIYEKEGVQKEFTIENYPKNDSTWVFVDQKQELISKGYEPPIHDFIVEDEDFNDITDLLLEFEGKTYLIVAYDLNKTNLDKMQLAQRIYNRTILLKNEKFYALTSSSDDEIATFREKTGVSYPFYRLDPTTLKTIVRSNPGVLILKKGTIEEKWHWRNFEWN